MADKLDKKALKNPDAFHTVSEKAYHWLENNLILLISAVAILLAGSAGYVGYGYWQTSQEHKAANALFQPEAELKKAEEAQRDAKAKTKTPAKAEDYGQVFAPHVEKLKTVIKEHANTKAALVSSVNLAYFLIQQDRYDEALEVIDLAQRKPASGDLLAGFFNMHKGLALMENRKYKEAAEAYQAVLGASALKYFHPEALLKMGLALELSGDLEKARLTYEKVGRDFPNSEASVNAQQYLRLLEMNSKQG